jgi:guanylate kinase
MSVTEIKRRGMMFVLSSPSGAGKTTISRRLMEMDSNLALSISITTRQMRNGEVNGKDYFFVNKEEFADLLMNDKLLEHAKVFDYYYGTPADFVEKSMVGGKDVIFDIDWQGTRKLAKIARQDMVSIFILPPSIDELERRLKSRAQDSDEVVRRRMDKAHAEISHWDEYDYVIINDDVDSATQKVHSILLAERLRRPRQVGMSRFVKGLKV